MNDIKKAGFWNTFVPVILVVAFCAFALWWVDAFSATVMNDNGQFESGAWISASMVTPDAAIWQAAAIPILVLAFRLSLPRVILISTMIALAHEVYGLAGLGIRGIGGPLEAALPFIMILMSYLVIGFVVNVRAGGEEEEDPHEAAGKLLKYGIFSLAAFFTVYTGVSIDELFAVLGRYEWMTAQGWSVAMQALNITIGMTYLWLILVIESVVIYGIVKLTRHTKPAQWLLDHEESIMFVVFSLLVYFVTRGWYQNMFGNQPTELVIGDFNTGFAYWVYLVGGLLPMFLLAGLLKIDFFERALLWLFKPQKLVIEAIEEWSERRVEAANDNDDKIDSAAA